MRIAIIGAGLTGLSAANTLLKAGHQVTVFEKSAEAGGLAGGFRKKNWDWSLEFFYHHFFTNDAALIGLVKELGITKRMRILRPVTSTLLDGNRGTYQLDSPLNLLRFPHLSPWDKFRTAALLGFCKLNPFWQPLETVTAQRLFKTLGGHAAWNLLWGPLMRGKFGTYARIVPASWLWSRFHKRTMRLGYFEGGFRTLVEALLARVRKLGGIVYTDHAIGRISRPRKGTQGWRIGTQTYDRILLTLPSPIATVLVRFPRNYATMLSSIDHLYAQTLILETDIPVLDGTYWLNINDRSFPFLAVVAHTNMVSNKYYGHRHVTYIGNYLPEGHPFLKKSKEELLAIFLPYIRRIAPHLTEKNVKDMTLFTAANAQPVHTLHYSRKAPPIRTGLPGMYLANMDSIYPWDRGTNYAVELGITTAQAMMRDVI